MFVSMDVIFRESEPFYGELTDLSLLFVELDELHSVEDGHGTEKVIQGDSMSTNTDDSVQVQVQPTMGIIQFGSLQVPV